MGEYRCANQVVVTVYSIRSPHRRNGMGSVRGVHGRFIEPIGQRQPLTRWGKFVVARCRTAAVQDRTEGIVAKIFGCDASNVGLDELADFLLERQLAEQRADARLEGSIGRERGRFLGPHSGMDYSRGFGGRRT